MEQDRLGRTRALRSLVQLEKYVAWRGHGKDNARWLSTKVTRYAITKVVVRLISNRLCEQPFVDRSAFSPPLQQLWITFKDRRLFEFNHRIRVEPFGPKKE